MRAEDTCYIAANVGKMKDEWVEVVTNLREKGLEKNTYMSEIVCVCERERACVQSMRSYFVLIWVTQP